VLAMVPGIFYRLRPALLGGTAPKTTSVIFTAAILMGVFLWQQLNLDAYRTKRPFARELKSMLTGISPGRIAFYHEAPPNILFYLDLEGPVQVVNNPESLAKFLAAGSDAKILVSEQKHISDLAAPLSTVDDVAHPELSEKTYPWERKTSKKFVAWKIEGRPESCRHRNQS
jgi:hypothetical protein